MAEFKILITDGLDESGQSVLRASATVDDRKDISADDLLKAIPEYDGLIVRGRTKVTASVIAASSSLKVIGRAGVGVDNVDVEAATRRGIVVANAPESTVTSAAEHTVGLLVALARNIPQAHAALKQGRWERSAWGGVIPLMLK